MSRGSTCHGCKSKQLTGQTAQAVGEQGCHEGRSSPTGACSSATSRDITEHITFLFHYGMHAALTELPIILERFGPCSAASN